MHDTPVLALELDRDPVLPVEFAANPLPAEVNAAGLQLQADGVHQVVGQDGNEQIPADAVGLVMIDTPPG
jgi:hypothetical protein